jgi:hypothetical protein
MTPNRFTGYSTSFTPKPHTPAMKIGASSHLEAINNSSSLLWRQTFPNVDWHLYASQTVHCSSDMRATSLKNQTGNLDRQDKKSEVCGTLSTCVSCKPTTIRQTKGRHMTGHNGTVQPCHRKDNDNNNRKTKSPEKSMKAIDTQAQQKCLNAETKQNGIAGLVCSINQPSQAA